MVYKPWPKPTFLGIRQLEGVKAMSSAEGTNVSFKTAASTSIEPSAYLLLRRAFRILKGCGLSSSHLGLLAAKALDDLQATPDIPLGGVSARDVLACCDVVLQWRRNCQFLDADGSPLALSICTGTPHFDELVNSAVQEHLPSDVLEVMLQLGVARMRDAETVELISDSVVACPGREKAAISSEIVLEHVCGFLGSVEYNVFDKPSRARGKFERACYAWVPRRHVPILEQLVSSRGQDFVDIIDEWLSRRTGELGEAQDSVLVGAGAYVFVRDHLGR